MHKNQSFENNILWFSQLEFVAYRDIIHYLWHKFKDKPQIFPLLRKHINFMRIIAKGELL